MALSKTGLKNLIIDKFTAQFGEPTKKSRPDVEKFAKVIADAIIEHFTDNAVVAVNVTTTVATSNAGLQSLPTVFAPNAATLGPATNQTLNGTGTGTIT